MSRVASAGLCINGMLCGNINSNGITVYLSAVLLLGWFVPLRNDGIFERSTELCADCPIL